MLYLLNMKRIITAITAIAAAALLTACSSKPSQPKMLVLYYSQDGTTQTVAEEIAAQTGADIERFDVDPPYTGTYDETIQRRRQDYTTPPKLCPLTSDLSKYDIIFLGYPIWFGSYATPVNVLMTEVSFQGKTIVPFCTFGSGGLRTSVSQIQEALPKTDVREGFGIRASRIDKVKPELERFLILGGYKEGEAEPYPDYSEQRPVTEEEAAIFEAACATYNLQYGAPLSVGTRETPAGKDYAFAVETPSPFGRVVKSKVYVNVAKEEGSAPELMMVER